MNEIYYISEKPIKNNHAGNKARVDLDNILGTTNLIKYITFNQIAVNYKVKKLFYILQIGYLKKLFKLTKIMNRFLIIQYPFYFDFIQSAENILETVQTAHAGVFLPGELFFDTTFRERINFRQEYRQSRRHCGNVFSRSVGKEGFCFRSAGMQDYSRDSGLSAGEISRMEAGGIGTRDKPSGGSSTGILSPRQFLRIARAPPFGRTKSSRIPSRAVALTR